MLADLWLRLTAPARTAGSAGEGETLAGYLQTFGIVLVAIVLLVTFNLLSPGFLQGDNVSNILMQVSIVGTAAIGETIVMLLSGIDLSVGSVILLSAVIMGALPTNHGIGVWLAVPAGLLAATVVGTVNGIFIAGVGIAPIIVTLGTLVAVQGLGQAILANEGSWIQVGDPFFLNIATGRLLGIPVMAIIMLALYGLGAILLRRTPLGRYIYAIGGNRRAAYLAGMRVRTTILVAFALSGLCAGVAGLLEVAQLGIVSQNVGEGMEFNAITAALVGGLSLSGGKGRLEKTLLGALIVAAITNYLTFRGVSAYYEQAITGGLILLAVLADHLSRQRGE